MGKKVSSVLFRINRFNNYKNFWIFAFKYVVHIQFIKQYYKIKNLFLKNFEDFQLNFFNKIYQFSGKMLPTTFNYYKALNKLIIFNVFSNVFGKIYRIPISFYSIYFIKYFIIKNIFKYTSIQMLYKQLYSNFVRTFNEPYNYPRIKIVISGRLNNTKLASSEIFQFGIISFNKINFFIKYEKFSIQTKYGLLGVKLWATNLIN